MLEFKPIHFDESINGWFVQQIWKDGFFHYDPTNFHGPLLFYLFQLSESLLGVHLFSFRFVTSLFSTLGLFLFYLLARKKHLWAFAVTLFLSVSPASVFFGRSAIHEAPFLFFQLILFFGVWLWFSEQKSQGLSLTILGFTGAFLLKETIAIFVLTLILSYLLSLFLLFCSRRSIQTRWLQDRHWSFSESEKNKISCVLMIAVFFYVCLFSGFGVYPKGLKDSVMAYLPWFKTGVAGNGHDKHFLYWIELILKNEWASVAGYMAAIWFLIEIFLISTNKKLMADKKSRIHRKVDLGYEPEPPQSFVVSEFTKVFIGSLTLLLLLIYSLIPYKTPWCLISIQWPSLLCLGFFFQDLVSSSKRWVKMAGGVLVLILWGHDLYYSQWLNFNKVSDIKHPYIYVQSTDELKTFSEALFLKANHEPGSLNFMIQVAVTESWPFPYVLGEFTRLSYQKVTDVLEPDVALLLVDQKEADLAREKLKDKKFSEFSLAVRDSREPLIVFYSREKYEGTFKKFEKTPEL